MMKHALVFSLILAVCNAARSEVSRLIEKPVPVPEVLLETQAGCRLTLVLTLCDSGNAPVDVKFDQLKSRKFLLLMKNSTRQVEQTLVLLKSVLITAMYNEIGSCIEVIMVSDRREYFDVIQERIFKTEKWDPSFTRFLQLKFVQANFPHGTEWLRNKYAPCATLRFFLPNILSNYDSVIYADTDIIFLGDIQELWNKFQSFSKTVVTGMSLIWNHSTWTPSEKLGRGKKLSSGIILMNLTRMRETQWTQKMMKIAKENSNKLILLPVQTILDIYYGANPNEIQHLPCHWNFGEINCWTPGYNKDEMLRREGVAVLHGYSLTFYEVRRRQPIFRAMYLLFQQTQLNSDFSLANFVQELEFVVKKAALKREYRSCRPIFQNFFLTKFQRLLKEHEYKIAANGRGDLHCQSETFCKIPDGQEPKQVTTV